MKKLLLIAILFFSLTSFSQEVLAPINPFVNRETGGQQRKYDYFIWQAPYQSDGEITYEVVSLDGELSFSFTPNANWGEYIHYPLRITYKGKVKEYQIRTVKDGVTSEWVLVDNR
jgi:hypothetical protein